MNSPTLTELQDRAQVARDLLAKLSKREGEAVVEIRRADASLGDARHRLSLGWTIDQGAEGGGLRRPLQPAEVATLEASIGAQESGLDDLNARLRGLRADVTACRAELLRLRQARGPLVASALREALAEVHRLKLETKAHLESLAASPATDPDALIEARRRGSELPLRVACAELRVAELELLALDDVDLLDRATGEKADRVEADRLNAIIAAARKELGLVMRRQDSRRADLSRANQVRPKLEQAILTAREKVGLLSGLSNIIGEQPEPDQRHRIYLG